VACCVWFPNVEAVLDYLKRKDAVVYQALIQKLGLRVANRLHKSLQKEASASFFVARTGISGVLPLGSFAVEYAYSNPRQ
jgi:hypothetical protein